MKYAILLIFITLTAPLFAQQPIPQRILLKTTPIQIRAPQVPSSTLQKFKIFKGGNTNPSSLAGTRSEQSPLKIDGKIGSGGGNLRPATFEEIRTVIEENKSGPVGMSPESRYILDPELRRLFKIWEDTPTTSPPNSYYSPVQYAVKKTRIKILERQACEHLGAPAAAAIRADAGFKIPSGWINPDEANRGGPGVELCFSLPLLQKRLQKGKLTESIDALIAHEYAHLFGAGERIAQKVEDFFLASKDNLMSTGALTLASDLENFEQGLGLLDWSLQNTTVYIAKRDSGGICWELNDLFREAFSLRQKIHITDSYDPKNNSEIVELYRELFKVMHESLLPKAYSASHYCGVNVRYGGLEVLKSPVIAKGDDAALLKSLGEIQSLSQHLRDLLDTFKKD